MKTVMYGMEKDGVIQSFDGEKSYFPARGERNIYTGFVEVSEIIPYNDKYSYIRGRMVTAGRISLKDILSVTGMNADVSILCDKKGEQVAKAVIEGKVHYYCMIQGEVVELMYSKYDSYWWLEGIFCNEIQQDGSVLAEKLDIKKDYFLIEGILSPCDFYDNVSVSLVDRKIVRISDGVSSRLYAKVNAGMVRLSDKIHMENEVVEDIKGMYGNMYKDMFITYGSDYRTYNEKPSDFEGGISTELWVRCMCFYRFSLTIDFIDLPCIRPEYFNQVTGYLDEILRYCNEKAEKIVAEKAQIAGDVLSQTKFNYKSIAKLR